MNSESSIGLGWEIAIPVTATLTPLPTDTPTITPSPTETQTPTMTLAANENETEISVIQSNQESFLHTPESNAKTFIFAGIIFTIIIAGTIIIINIIWKKK